MDKYQVALLELARAQKAVRDVNRKIGAALYESHHAAESQWPKDWLGIPKAPTEWADLGGKNLWLKLAYQQAHEGYGSWYYVNHDDDVEGYLAENCQHALRAHLLIKERKELRKALGVAKRRVSLLGNRLLADEAK